MNEIIKINHLEKYYHKNIGIKDVNITINKGDFFGFIGPNGAGKSTTIRTLLGLIKPTGGSASIMDLDIVKDQKEILKHVGYLPSEVNFYEGMKVKDIIKLSADLRHVDCYQEGVKIAEALTLNLEAKVEDLSLGNKKKLGIVVALQHNPEILILDEPTSGLDPLIKKEFFDILKKRNEEGVTIFYSSHILSEIEHFCNKAAIIKDGVIIVSDNIDTLTKTKIKRVRIKGDVSLKDLKHVSKYEENEHHTTFLYDGDINDLIKELAKYKINDLNIEELELEETFMHFYQGENK